LIGEEFVEPTINQTTYCTPMIYGFVSVYGQLMKSNGCFGQNFLDVDGIFSEQATRGVRKLRHFLCKDPTAYGATGQN